MKLATLKDGTRDGDLLVVSRDLSRALKATEVAPSLQAALDDWAVCCPKLETLYLQVNSGEGFPLDPACLMAPLPRAYQWADGSAYLTHVERVRKARGAQMPPGAESEPLMYQGGSDSMLGARDAVPVADEAWGIDLEAEVGVITGDVPMGVAPDQAGGHVRLVVLLNDVSLRNLTAAELAKGFGFFNSKSWTGFSPVAVTPDELGVAWDGTRVHLPLLVQVNGKELGHPDAGRDMSFDFPRLISHAAKTRPLGAGTIIGSGTVSNRDRAVGVACLAEQRALETIETGQPRSPFLRYGDTVRIEMLDGKGHSIFGAIEQSVARVGAPV
ncbi:MAG TPA: fumarylacetoacetate hydrolase family protein [Burkholderiales bacterium]|nr:fumarylacetoacetate hydrolase family protein [Burkholderiales bacterium]